MHDRNDKAILPFDRDAILQQLRGKHPEEVFDWVIEKLSISAEAFDAAAIGIEYLDEIGFDLNSRKLTMLPYLRRIAKKMLLSAALVRLYGKPHILVPFSHLALPEQQRLLSDGVVLGARDEHGQIRESKPKPVEALSKTEAERVFEPASPRPRTPVEQVAWEREREKLVFVPEGMPIRWVNGAVDVVRPVRLTKKDVRMMAKHLGLLE